MTSRAISVQWAWRGKEPNDSGYRILSCSMGDFNAKNFEDILDRFSLGTVADPSQVAVSYVLSGDARRHLGMAIYEPTAAGADPFGRDVTFIRYFCVPYEDVAPDGVCYVDMYGTLKNRMLPQANEPPLSVEFSRGDPGIPGDAARASQVTELLLTGNPVCIVGAGDTTMGQRLAFIDAVMRLLPYGMRAEMAAATWTSSTNRQHKFRLFFSDAPRRQPDSGPDDHLVAWRTGKLEVRPALSPRFNPEWAGEYHDWLRPLLEKSVAETLAGRTEPRSFKAPDVLKMVEAATETRGRNIFRLRHPAPRADTGGNPPAAGPAGATPQAGRPVAHERPVVHERREKPDPAPADRIALLISGLERDLRGGKAPFAEAAAEQLAIELMKDQPSDAQRRHYQAIIKRDRLLREDLELGKNKKGPFYKVLLRAAFAELSYGNYLRIEDMLGGEAPHKQLMQVIYETATDRRLKFVVTYAASGGQLPKSAYNPLPLIDIAADPELRDDHAQLVWAALMMTLETVSPGDRGVARAALRERGFLAHRLRARKPFDQTYQASALVELLEALYGRPINAFACREIFTGYQHAPTDAMLLATLQLVSPDALPQLLFYFIDRYARSPEIGQNLRQGLADLGYGSDPEASPGAPADGHDAAEPISGSGQPLADGEIQVKQTRMPDPQGPRRRPWDRVVIRRGEFSKAEATEAVNKQQDDDR
jgi:hypothetical protein